MNTRILKMARRHSRTGARTWVVSGFDHSFRAFHDVWGLTLSWPYADGRRSCRFDSHGHQAFKEIRKILRNQ